MSQIRNALITALKADYDLSLIISKRVYPQTTPANIVWPFIRLGAREFTPQRFSGGDGALASGVIHIFTKKSDAKPDAEAAAEELCVMVERIVDTIELPHLNVYVRQSQVIQDPDESTGYHGIVNYEAMAV